MWFPDFQPSSPKTCGSNPEPAPVPEDHPPPWSEGQRWSPDRADVEDTVRADHWSKPYNLLPRAWRRASNHHLVLQRDISSRPRVPHHLALFSPMVPPNVEIGGPPPLLDDRAPSCCTVFPDELFKRSQSPGALCTLLWGCSRAPPPNDGGWDSWPIAVPCTWRPIRWWGSQVDEHLRPFVPFTRLPTQASHHSFRAPAGSIQ